MVWSNSAGRFSNSPQRPCLCSVGARGGIFGYRRVSCGSGNESHIPEPKQDGCLRTDKHSNTRLTLLHTRTHARTHARAHARANTRVREGCQPVQYTLATAAPCAGQKHTRATAQQQRDATRTQRPTCKQRPWPQLGLQWLECGWTGGGGCFWRRCCERSGSSRAPEARAGPWGPANPSGVPEAGPSPPSSSNAAAVSRALLPRHRRCRGALEGRCRSAGRARGRAASSPARTGAGGSPRQRTEGLSGSRPPWPRNRMRISVSGQISCWGSLRGVLPLPFRCCGMALGEGQADQSRIQHVVVNWEAQGRERSHGDDAEQPPHPHGGAAQIREEDMQTP